MTAYLPPGADPTAVVGRRIAAYAIDLVLVGVAALALLVPIFMDRAITAPSGTVECNSGSNDGVLSDRTSTSAVEGPAMCFDDGTEVHYIPRDEENAFTAQVYGIGFGFQFLNLVLLQGLVGASVGKLLLGLRVVRSDGSRAGIGWAALRWILLFVDSLCCFLPGAVMVFSTKGHRRIGDMAASTFVVRREHVGAPVLVPGVTAPEFYPSAGPGGPGGWPGGPPGGGYGGGYDAPSGWGTGTGSAAPGWGADTGGTAPGWGTGTGGTAPGWGPPPGGTGQGSSPTPVPGADGPTWDPARDTYIQYDRNLGAWVEWDEVLMTWKPISQ